MHEGESGDPPRRGAAVLDGLRERVPTRPAVLGTLALWAPLLLWYAAFRPGIMSADSLWQWDQAARGAPWFDQHPPVYTAVFWLSHQLIGSPSLVPLLQTLLLAAALTSLVRAVIRIGANPAWTWAFAGLLTLTPMVGVTSVSLWKDVPYLAVLVFIAARLVDATAARLVEDEAGIGRALRSVFAWCVAAVLLRQNGALVVVVLAVGLVLTFRRHWRIVAVGAPAAIAVLLVAKFIVYPAVGVHRTPNYWAMATLLHDLGAVAARAPEVLEPDDRAVLEEVAPLDAWASGYNGFGCDSTNWQFLPIYDWAPLDEHPDEFVKVWLESVNDATEVVARNRICLSALAWFPGRSGDLYTVSRGIDPNTAGLETVPVFEPLHDAADWAIDRSGNPKLVDVLWRGVIWVYVAYAALAFAALRSRRPIVLLPGLVLLALQLSIIPVNPAQDARYMIGGLVIGVLLLPYAASMARLPRAAPPEPPPHPDPPADRLVESGAV